MPGDFGRKLGLKQDDKKTRVKGGLAALAWKDN
jgi:hypothetical protein